MNINSILNDLYDETYKPKNQFITESVFLNKENLYFNMDKLKPNTDSNVLFITGFPGAGKSTTLKQIDDKYEKIIAISMDLFTIEAIKKRHSMEWFKSKGAHPLLTKYMLKNVDKIHLTHKKFNSPELVNYYIEFISWLRLQTMKPEYKGYIIVIEGTQIFNMFKEIPEYFENKPLILIGTSVITSYIRKAKRDIFNGKDLDMKHLKTLITMIPVYSLYNKTTKDIISNKYNDN